MVSKGIEKKVPGTPLSDVHRIVEEVFDTNVYILIITPIIWAS